MSIAERAPGKLLRADVMFLIFAASFAALVVSLFIIAKQISKLQEQAVVEEARSLAREIDAALLVRIHILDAATRRLEMRDFLKQGGIRGPMKIVQEQFEDFLALGVVDVQGKAIAMAGDLLGIGSGPNGRMAFELLRNPISSFQELEWLFTDAPKQNAFEITIKRSDADGKIWFITGRFSRDTLEEIIASATARTKSKIRLLSNAGRETSKFAYRTDATTDATTIGDGKLSSVVESGLIRAQMPLAVAGALVDFENDPRSPFTTLAPLIVAGIIVLCTLLAALVRAHSNRAPRAASHNVPVYEDDSAYAESNYGVVLYPGWGYSHQYPGTAFVERFEQDQRTAYEPMDEQAPDVSLNRYIPAP